jgi:hypothetical protein
MERLERRLECEMEAEVLAAIAESRWPAGPDAKAAARQDTRMGTKPDAMPDSRMAADLRAHAAQCPICADVVAVAGAVLSDRRNLRSTAAIPDAGRIWWQAQLRARREAAVTAGRPITAAQLIAFGCAVGLLGACFGATSEWFQAGLKWVAARIAALHPGELIPPITALLTEHFAIALTITAAFLLIPAALYLAVGRD